MPENSVLFIRNDEFSGQKIVAALEEGSEGTLEWVHVDTLFDGLRSVQEGSFDLILCDLILPDSKGLNTLRDIKKEAPQTPVIVLCHAIDRDMGVSAVRQGAHDFFCYEDVDATTLKRSVALALKDQGAKGSGSGADRRTHARFPCRLAVSYQALEHPFFSGNATSETVNISSKGLLFAASEPLEPGQLLQVSVDWPARLENEVALKLVAEGRVIRIIDGQAAVRIDKYEFRTRKAKAPATGQAQPAAAGKRS